MPTDIYPEQIQIKPVSLSSGTSAPPRHRPGEEFLKGPIPTSWLKRAACLPGKALHVALALWHRAGMRRTRVIMLPARRLAAWGTNRYSAYRALAALEQAGLVAVERRAGRLARVTLLDAPDRGLVRIGTKAK